MLALIGGAMLAAVHVRSRARIAELEAGSVLEHERARVLELGDGRVRVMLEDGRVLELDALEPLNVERAK